MPRMPGYSGSERGLPQVPRSKGCSNCVSRKSRCDGRKPSCKACEDRKQACSGYRRSDFTFLNEGWRAPGVASRPRRNNTGRIRASRPAASALPAAGPNSAALVVSKPLAPDPLELCVTFFMSQFSSSLLPRGSDFLHRNCRRCCALLLDRPAGARSNQRPLIYAADALVTGHFARLHHANALIQASVRSYAAALKSLSAALAEALQCVGIAAIPEADWMDLVFSCLLLLFWEVSMNPNSTNWQNHARGLANLIDGRGPRALRSPTSLEAIAALRMPILLESISSKRPTFLSQPRWQAFRTFRLHPPPLSAVLHPAINRDEAALVAASRMGPAHYLDFIFDRLIAISALLADCTRLREAMTTGEEAATALCYAERLKSLQADGAVVLQQVEAALASLRACAARPSTLLADEGRAVMRTPRKNTTSQRDDSSMAGWGSPSRGIVEYILTSLFRTAAMSLRLMFMGGGRTDDPLYVYSSSTATGATSSSGSIGGGPPPGSSEKQQRAALMLHVRAVLDSIPDSTRPDVFGAAPFSFVPAFGVAQAFLAAESHRLAAEGTGMWEADVQLEQLNEMRELVRRHLDFVGSKKIPIKVDF